MLTTLFEQDSLFVVKSLSTGLLPVQAVIVARKRPVGSTSKKVKELRMMT